MLSIIPEWIWTGKSGRESHVELGLTRSITSEWYPFSKGYPVVTKTLAIKTCNLFMYVVAYLQWLNRILIIFFNWINQKLTHMVFVCIKTFSMINSQNEE